ncbi:MAG: hypothetical protein LBG89_00420 [Rickettsiales bacterium]|jgi:hypothetical protein|nr:hypothetical protein [Rickettsiales bacterium]
MMVAIFMGILPMIYKQIVSREEMRAAALESHVIAEARDALLRYIEANETRLSSNAGTAIYQVRPEDLKPFGFDAAGKSIKARVIKMSDNAGHSYLQGIVVSELRDITPMRTRHVAMAGGEGAGYVAGNQMYGSFGTWQQSLSMWNVSARREAVATQTPVVWKSGDWLWRASGGRKQDSVMLSDLDMNNNDIIGIGMMDAKAAHVGERIEIEWGEATSLSFAENIAIEKEFIVAGEANVLGNLTSESGDLVVAGNVLLGNAAKFRGVEAGRLKVGNLVLEGVNSGFDGGVAKLSIGQHLGLSNGSITAEMANFGMFGAVATSVAVASGIVDSSDPSRYWDFSEREAAMNDVMLANMGSIMRAVIKSESASGASTEMEKVLAPVASNANATAADYLRAMATAISRVEQKYAELGLE